MDEGYHCDCWDQGHPCCHCGSESEDGNCPNDQGVCEYAEDDEDLDEAHHADSAFYPK